MIMTQLDVTRGIPAQMTELLLYGHGECIQRLPVGTAIVGAPAKRLGILVLGHGEEADIEISEGANLCTIDRPHDVRSVCDDPVIMFLVRTQPGAVRRQQSISAHQPQTRWRAARSPSNTRSRAQTLRCPSRI